MTERTFLYKTPFISLERLSDGALLLSVECGTTAVYDLRFCLNEAELQQYHAEGNAYLESLAGKVMAFPDHFSDRHRT